MLTGTNSCSPHGGGINIVHGALGALAGWALWAQSLYWVPDRFLGIVIAAVTVASAGLTVVFWVLTVFENLGAAPGASSAARASTGPSGARAGGPGHSRSTALISSTYGKLDLLDPAPHRAASRAGIANHQLGARPARCRSRRHGR